MAAAIGESSFIDAGGVSERQTLWSDELQIPRR